MVYHVGFDENYRRLSFAFDMQRLRSRDASMAFRVDLQKMFAAHATIDMAALSNVKFDRNDAALLAGNYAEMISPL